MKQNKKFFFIFFNESEQHKLESEMVILEKEISKTFDLAILYHLGFRNHIFADFKKF